MKVRQAFGEALRSVRKRRGLTLDETIARCEELNDGDALGLDKARLSRIERSKGQHAVRIDQWLLLAAALDTPPLLLVVPLGASEPVEITATSKIHSHLAYRWLTGQESLASTKRLAINQAGWYRMSEPVRLYERLHRAQSAVGMVDRGPWARSEGPEVAEAYDELADTLLALHRSGLDAPDQNPWTYARLAEASRHPHGLGVDLFAPDDWYEGRDEPVPLRHPLIDGVVLVPGDHADAYIENGNWTRSDR